MIEDVAMQYYNDGKLQIRFSVFSREPLRFRGCHCGYEHFAFCFKRLRRFEKYGCDPDGDNSQVYRYIGD